MKRSPISLLSYLTRPEPKTLARLFSRHYISNSISSASLQSCTRTRTNGPVLNSLQFLSIPFRNTGTLVEQNPQMSARERKLKERSELEEAFELAETSEEMHKLLRRMESYFQESELGLAFLKVGLKLDQEGEDPEKALAFAARALKALDKDDNKPNLLVAMSLQLMGSALYSLKRFNESLGTLHRANRMLSRLKEEGTCRVEDMAPVHHAVLLEIANVKTALGRREEALEDLRKCLEIKEMTLEKDSKELGVANRDLAEAYVAVLNFKEALQYGLKALEIHKSGLGNNSVEVAHDRKLLGVIYTGLEEHEKALEQNDLSQKVFKNWGLSSDVLQAEIDASNMKIALGKYDEAINTLKGVVQLTEKDSETRALVFISMAKALANQEKFADSKRCLEIACGILDKKETVSPVDVAEAYSEIAMQYETMNEFETAISLLKRTLSFLEKLPQEQPSEGSVSARLGWLLLLTGKVSQAIPYLESAAERLKESFGLKHFGVGYIYNNLGAAYLELDRPESAVQMFTVAKEVMDIALGPHHADSIEACQNLAKAFGAMGRSRMTTLHQTPILDTSHRAAMLGERPHILSIGQNYGLALDYMRRAIEAWESHGPSAQDELIEARRLQEQLRTKAQSKTKARGASTNSLPIKALPLPQSSPSGGSLQSGLSLSPKQTGTI